MYWYNFQSIPHLLFACKIVNILLDFFKRICVFLSKFVGMKYNNYVDCLGSPDTVPACYENMWYTEKLCVTYFCTKLLLLHQCLLYNNFVLLVVCTGCSFGLTLLLNVCYIAFPIQYRQMILNVFHSLATRPIVPKHFRVTAKKTLTHCITSLCGGNPSLTIAKVQQCGHVLWRHTFLSTFEFSDNMKYREIVPLKRGLCIVP